MKTYKKILAFILIGTLMVSTFAFSLFAVNAATYSKDNMLSTDWTTYWQGPAEKTTEGIKVVTNASYNTALNPDYIAFDMKVGNLLDNDQGWISFGFENILADLNADANNNGTNTKLRYFLRNDAGKINIDGYNIAKDENLINRETFSNVNITDNLKFVFAKDTVTGKWYLSINGTQITDTTGKFSNIVASDFCKTDGNTYLAFASYTVTPDNITREDALNYTIESISTDRPVQTPPTEDPSLNAWKADWQNYYWDLEKTTDGIKVVCDATYKVPLDPDYTEFKINIGNLLQNNKGWVMFGFENAIADINDGISSKIRFYLRNDGGKLNVYGENVTQNANLSDFLKLDNIAAIGDITVVFAKDTTTDKWYVSFNGTRMLDASGNVAKIVSADFCNTANKTYLGFASWSETPNNMTRQDALNYTVKSISNVRPAAPTVQAPTYLPGAQLTEYNAPYGGVQSTDYSTFHADIQYNKPLNPSYIKAVFNIEKLTQITSETQFNAMIIATLGNKNEMPNTDDPSKLEKLPGISVILRNLNGKLLIDINGYGEGIRSGVTAWTFVRKATNINTLNNKLTLVFKRNSSNTSYDIYLNETKLNDDNTVIMPDSKVLTNGKTYLSFLARCDGKLDSTQSRVWRMYEVTDVKNPNTSDNGANLFFYFVIVSLSLTGVMVLKKRKIKAKK